MAATATKTRRTRKTSTTKRSVRKPVKKSTAKKVAAKKSRGAKPSNGRTKAVEQVWRVYSCDENVRNKMKKARAEQGLSVATYVEIAVDSHLDALVAQLLDLQFSKPEDRRPIRLPLTDNLLAKLKAGSEKTGIPASSLLFCALSMQAEK